MTGQIGGREVHGAARSALAAFAAALIAACGSGRETPLETIGGPVQPFHNIWVWIRGSNSTDATGVYGTAGVAALSNAPGARSWAASWKDSAGNIWLFGGSGLDSTGTSGFLNGLWKFDGYAWTWMGGSNVANAAGVYGTKGTGATSNIPGARARAASWTDGAGNFWLFGGTGVDSTGSVGPLNDLWEYKPGDKTWTWMSGSDLANDPGAYGTKGVASPGNAPGARYAVASWTDISGNLWLFGGLGPTTVFNDLWEYNPTTDTWIWMGGSNTTGAPGVYGTKGIADATNVPGARHSAASWRDRSGNLWLFGGSGIDATGASGSLNDLWKFDGANWTWMGGSYLVNAAGAYGWRGLAAADNMPGARYSAAAWTNRSGNAWLFAGTGYDSTRTQGQLNDIWKFDGANWTWMGGSTLADAAGVYGWKGVPAAANIPGARAGAASWTDDFGDLWLFGGIEGTGLKFNDLWAYHP